MNNSAHCACQVHGGSPWYNCLYYDTSWWANDGDGRCELQEVDQQQATSADARNTPQGFHECALVHWESAVRYCRAQIFLCCNTALAL
jgi:hypothetical protein